MTTAHLPECHTSMIPDFHNEKWICICAALRACEQRVVDTIRRDSWYEDGWNRALDAARERLIYVALNYSTDPEFHALAAIDALRNPPSLPPTTGRELKY